MRQSTSAAPSHARQMGIAAKPTHAALATETRPRTSRFPSAPPARLTGPSSKAVEDARWDSGKRLKRMRWPGS